MGCFVFQFEDNDAKEPTENGKMEMDPVVLETTQEKRRTIMNAHLQIKASDMRITEHTLPGMHLNPSFSALW